MMSLKAYTRSRCATENEMSIEGELEFEDILLRFLQEGSKEFKMGSPNGGEIAN
jgi:hypothetical protein